MPMPRHLLRTLDLGPAELARILDLAAHLKADPFARSDLLRNQTVVLHFNKPSTRISSPKVEAAAWFARRGRAVIASLDQAVPALAGGSGTLVPP